MMFLALSAMPLLAACGGSMSTPIAEVQVVNISIKEDRVRQLSQVKVFDQCAASSPFRPDVRFSQAESETSGEELVVRGQVGGNIGLSEVAQLQIGAAVEKKFASSRNVTYAYSEGGGIEVPPHTRQEYTLIWKEIRRAGTVEYIEEGVSKTADYEYRIGLELVATTGRDLPCPETPTPVPEYQLYDDFEMADALSANWRWDDPEALCRYEVRAGQLWFNCSGDPLNPRLAALYPTHPADKTTGVAAVVALEKAEDPFQLVTKWQNQADGSRWAYHLEATPGWVRAIKYDLKTGYEHPLRLGEGSVAVGVAHRLQIERTDDSLLFLIDGKQFAVEKAAHISPHLTMDDWCFDFRVGDQGSSIQGQIDQVSTKN